MYIQDKWRRERWREKREKKAGRQYRAIELHGERASQAGSSSQEVESSDWIVCRQYSDIECCYACLFKPCQSDRLPLLSPLIALPYLTAALDQLACLLALRLALHCTTHSSYIRRRSRQAHHLVLPIVEKPLHPSSDCPLGPSFNLENKNCQSPRPAHSSHCRRVEVEVEVGVIVIVVKKQEWLVVILLLLLLGNDLIVLTLWWVGVLFLSFSRSMA